MAWNPAATGAGTVKRPTDVLVADGRGGQTSIAQQPALTGAAVDEDRAQFEATARTGLNSPGAGAEAVTGTLVTR